jgi:SAM-dependent methyltransferase
MTSRASTIDAAYDESTALLRGLRMYGWGPLLNLGYYRLRELPLLALGLGFFQRRLALESLALLDPRPDERILDVACGRGWTTDRIARRGAEGVGLDLLERHVHEARRRFGEGPSCRFVQGDATCLCVGDASFDKLHCLEAGFQLGPDGRLAFLREAYRALRPGGRLVLVDFVWTTSDPSEIDAFDPDRAVRDTWRFEEFEPLARYRERAAACGFREVRAVDWTTPVLRRFQAVGDLITTLGLYRVPRWILCLFRPAWRRAPLEDWFEVHRVVQAHSRVRQRTRYLAMVLEKPRESAVGAA